MAVVGGGAEGSYKKAATEGDVKAAGALFARALEPGRAMRVVKGRWSASWHGGGGGW